MRLIMTNAPQDKSIEQRRRVLKGALGASTVVTLGYGAPVAAASLNCIAKVDGGYPAGSNQFFLGDQPPDLTPGNWAWRQVPVNMYAPPVVAAPPATGGQPGKGKGRKKDSDEQSAPEAASDAVEGFEVSNLVYSTTPPHDPLVGVEAQTAAGYPKVGWVLVYFDENGEEIGTYPAYTMDGDGFAPASESCLNSINPGAAGNYTYGG
ncbi:hypothetical protein [Thauera propionica]|uniref:hypothetical protein n=1 Tax=Thauera propionica TaxID=2019431 RepID=UPI001055CFD4|nr:hypothetical protein [Thauera propionica]